MNKIAFITPGDTEFGFKLTGADQYVTDKDNLMAALKKVMLEGETGLVIVDERLMSAAQEEKLREIEHGWHGILIVLPSPDRPGAEVEDYASRLIRRAIGYHVRLNI